MYNNKINITTMGKSELNVGDRIKYTYKDLYNKGNETISYGTISGMHYSQEFICVKWDDNKVGLAEVLKTQKI